MLKIQIQISQINLQFKFPQADQPSKIYLKFQYKQSQIWTDLNDKIQFKQKLQKINISHEVHVKKSQMKNKKLQYQILIIQARQRDEEVRILKLVGCCEFNMKDFASQLTDKPIGYEQKIKLQKCPDKQAYLKFKTIISQLEQFKEFFTSEFQLKRQISSHIGQEQLHLQQQRQLLSQTKKESSRIQSRNNRLETQINHLKMENKQLVKEIKQKQKAINIDQQLKEGKLDMLIQRKLNAEEEYKKVKENISKIFNVINEYGRPDVVDEISNLLANRKH